MPAPLPLALALAAAAAAQVATPAPAPAKDTDTGLISPALISRAEAAALVDRAVRACEKRGETASAFVTDADGNLRAQTSSDNGKPIGLRTATLKTAAVLAFHASTRELQRRVATDPAFAEHYGKDPRYFYHPGALPLFRDGRFVAVLAVGGGHDQDEACAMEALAPLGWAKTAP